MKKLPRKLFLSTLTIFLLFTIGCATSPISSRIMTGDRAQVRIQPETLFKFEGFTILSPNTEGWVIIKKHATEIWFGKPTSKGAYHTIRAKVSTIRNKIFLSTKELKTFIETDVRDNLPSRHRNVTLRTSIERVHGVECVSYDIEMEDHAVPDAPGKVFDMTVTGHFCPHPDFPESYVIDIQYSQRFLKGEKPLPNESERDSFINSLGFMQLD